MAAICVVQIGVTDMDQAIGYYGMLGFTVLAKPYYPHYVELDHDGKDHFHLVLAKAERLVEDPYPTGSQTLVNIATTDLRATMEQLRARGIVALQAEPQPCPVGIFAAYRDPFGNAFEIVEFSAAVPPR